MTDLTLADLADQVLSANSDGTKYEWGSELLDLVHAHDEPGLDAEVRGKTVVALGNLVNGRKSAQEKAAQQQRVKSLPIDYNGRPLASPTISVRGETGARQGVLWINATPQQYIEAVIREQRVVDGRNNANAIRLQLVEVMQRDEHLLTLSTLKDVCEELDINPDTLGLEDLEAAS